MKKIGFILGFLAMGMFVFPQPWLNRLPQYKLTKNLTLFDYQKAFEDYWAPFHVVNGFYDLNGVKTKAGGWKQFYRWYWNMENQVDKAGRFPNKTAQQVYDEYQKSKPVYTRSSLANWSSLGSNSSEGGYAGVGRLNCIAFHPFDNNTFWVGAPSGSLWVTTNAGSNWTCLTDQNNVLGVSDIVIPSDYATSKTIYIATGDKDAWDNRSIGVLKSTNGGITWDTTGIRYSLSDDAMVTRLLLDPNNNQTLIAATTNGVYKTTDGGTTWNTYLSLVKFDDIEYKPGDFNTLYGATESGGIYMSTNGGIKWNQILHLQYGRRTELAVSPNEPTWVYAVSASSNNGLYAIFKSTNSGASYTKIFDGKIPGQNLLGWTSDGSDSGGQGSYDLSIAVSPSDANSIMIGGVSTGC